MARFCPYCGTPVPEGSKFCVGCGKPLAKPEAQPEPQPAAQPEPQPAANPAPAFRPAFAPQLRELAAPASTGEIVLGELGLPGPAELTDTVTKVLSPVSGVLQSVKSFFGGILQAFKNPVTLIGVLLFAVLWFVLSLFRDSDSGIVKALSWLTFSEGGLGRSIPGALGGVLGKGAVAAALLSLSPSGLKNTGKGVAALFTGHGEKRSILSLIIGTVVGGALYFAFAGLHASAGTTMAGLAGVLLSLQALGGGSGKLYSLAQSLTSRAANGVREAARGRCDGLLTGLTAGFALATAVSAFL